MVDPRLRTAIHLISCVLQSPAQVNFLHVGKEAIIKSSNLVVQVGSDEHAGASGPKDLFRLIVLVLVDLQVLEHASTAERIAILVNEAATRTGIFKLVLVVVRQDLRLAGSNLRVGIHEFDDGFYPMRSHLDIRVEQHIILGIHLPQGKVVSRCKTAIAAILDQTNVREVLTHESHRIVSGSVISHYNLSQSRVAVGDDIRKKLFEEFLSIVVQYDDGHLHTFSV